MRFFLAAHALVPKEPKFLLSAANMYLKSGRADEALKLYERLRRMRCAEGCRTRSLHPAGSPEITVMDSLLVRPMAIALSCGINVWQPDTPPERNGPSEIGRRGICFRWILAFVLIASARNQRRTRLGLTSNISTGIRHIGS